MPRKNPATLSLFLQALEGSQCIVELHSDSVVKGRLESVDGGMNIVMKDVVIKDVYGRTQKSSSLHMRASAIRLRPVAFQATIPIYIIVTVIKISLISARWRKRVAL
ncbi:hypothetical protein M9435_001293 [Picochlorum sp. BPE23]|nr:hypothetical protein M9435_001293 [Picochlorum sp. BPE23]